MSGNNSAPSTRELDKGSRLTVSAVCLPLKARSCVASQRQPSVPIVCSGGVLWARAFRTCLRVVFTRLACPVSYEWASSVASGSSIAHSSVHMDSTWGEQQYACGANALVHTLYLNPQPVLALVEHCMYANAACAVLEECTACFSRPFACVACSVRLIMCVAVGGAGRLVD